MLFFIADRVPVIFGEKEASDAWLNGSSSKVNTLLKPYENLDLVRGLSRLLTRNMRFLPQYA